eukprot:m.185012 g.185012  ORF g.185012 m.185012 type:complete len:728 (+) comp24713_c1_seq1:268-2451(+)
MDALEEARRAEKHRKKKERKAREKAFAQLEAEASQLTARDSDGDLGDTPELIDDDPLGPGTHGADATPPADCDTEARSESYATREFLTASTSVSLLASVIASDAAAEEGDPIDPPTPVDVDMVTSFRDLGLRSIGPLATATATSTLTPLGSDFVGGVQVLLSEKRRATQADGTAAAPAPATPLADPSSEPDASESTDAAVASEHKPSPIQSAAWGCLLQLLPPDVVAIAPTGSGKTLAFLIPVVARALAEQGPPLDPAATAEIARARARDAATQEYTRLVGQGELPVQAKEAAKIAYTQALTGAVAGTAGPLPPALGKSLASPAHLVLSPTRELCLQLELVLQGLIRHVAPSLRAMAVVGGEGYAHQAAELIRIQPHCIVATPGRLLSHCGRSSKTGHAAAEATEVPSACSLAKIQTVVLDEADMLLDLGFEDALVEVLSMVPDKRWTMLFSATFPPAVRRLAGRVVTDGALYIKVGDANLAAAKSVEQRVEILRGKGAPRFRRLCALLTEFGVTSGADDARDGERGRAKILVFVLYKREARDIGKALVDRGFAAVSLSGDMSQRARVTALSKFHNDEAEVLVATDVAARGLDIQGISHVVNFSLGTSIESFVHRVGRCGRAGRTGIAHSFVVDGDEHLLESLIAVMNRTHQRVPPDVVDLAAKYRAQCDRLETKQIRGDAEMEDAEALEELRRENEEKQKRHRDLAAQRSKGKAGGEPRRRGKKKK